MTSFVTEWIKQNSSFNTNGDDTEPSIAIDGSGNTYVAYSTTGVALGQTKTGSQDIVVTKFDSNGNTQWVTQQPTFNTSDCNCHPAIGATSSGDVYISYEHTKPEGNFTTTDVLEIEVPPNGTEVEQFNSSVMWQSFTATQDIITRYGAFISCANCETPSNYFIRLREGEGLSGNLLHSYEYFPTYPYFKWVIASSITPISVVIGQKYTIEVEYKSGLLCWRYNTINLYAGGHASIGNGNTFCIAVQTVVIQPEPDEYTVSPSNTHWQSFTATHVLITQFSLYIANSQGGSGGYYLVNVRNGEGSTGTVLYTTNYYPLTTNLEWITIIPSPIAVTIGQKYTIEVQSQQGMTYWGYTLYKSYLDGMSSMIAVYAYPDPGYLSDNDFCIRVQDVDIPTDLIDTFILPPLGQCWQSFTATATIMTEYSFYIRQVGDAFTKFSLRSGEGMSGSLLHTFTITYGSTEYYVYGSEWVKISIPPPYVTLTIGQKYSLCVESGLTPTTNKWMYYRSNFDTSGKSCLNDSYDFCIRAQSTQIMPIVNDFTFTKINSQWQSFTTTANTLTQYSVYIANSDGGGYGSYLIRLREREGTVGQILYSAEIQPLNTSFAWMVVNLPSPISVNIGCKYTIEVISLSGITSWPYYSYNIYTGGRSSINNKYDFCIDVQTINVPYSSPLTYAITSGTYCWQSFTAISNNRLDQYSVYLSNSLGSSGQFEISLLNGEGDLGAVLYTRQLSPANTNSKWYNIVVTVYGDVTSNTIPLTNGNKYTIRVRSISGTTYWNYHTAYNYTGGISSIDSNYDFSFRVYTIQDAFFSEIVIFKLNTLGVQQWIRRITTNNTNQIDFQQALTLSSSGDVYISYKSYTLTTIYGGGNAWWRAIKSEGCNLGQRVGSDGDIWIVNRANDIHLPVAGMIGVGGKGLFTIYVRLGSGKDGPLIATRCWQTPNAWQWPHWERLSAGFNQVRTKIGESYTVHVHCESGTIVPGQAKWGQCAPTNTYGDYWMDMNDQCKWMIRYYPGRYEQYVNSGSRDDIVVMKLRGSDGVTLWNVRNPGGTSLNDEQPSLIVNPVDNHLYLSYKTYNDYTDTYPRPKYVLSYNPIYPEEYLITANQSCWQSFTAKTYGYINTVSISVTEIGPDSEFDLIIRGGEGIGGPILAYTHYILYVPGRPIIEFVTQAQLVPGQKYTIQVHCSDVTHHEYLKLSYSSKPPFYEGGTSNIPNGALLFEVDCRQIFDSIIVVCKLNNTTGSLIWKKTDSIFNGTMTNQQPSIGVDSLGDIYVTYYTDGLVYTQEKTGPLSIVVFKLNNSGTFQWIRQQSLFNARSVNMKPVISVASRGIYIAYQTDGEVDNHTLTGQSDVVFFKINNVGEVIWVKQESIYNTTGHNVNPRIVADSNGNIYLTYQSDGLIPGQTYCWDNDVIVMKIKTPDAYLLLDPYYGTLNPELIKVGTLIKFTIRLSNPDILTINNIQMTDLTHGINISLSYLDPQTSWTSIGDYTYPITQNDIDTGQVVSTVDVTGQSTSGNISFQQTTTIPITYTPFIIQWINQQPIFNTQSDDLRPSIAVSITNNVYVSYYTYGSVSGQSNYGRSDVAIFKLNEQGHLQWITQIPFNNSYDDIYPSISVDSGDNPYVAYLNNQEITVPAVLPDPVLAVDCTPNSMQDNSTYRNTSFYVKFGGYVTRLGFYGRFPNTTVNYAGNYYINDNNLGWHYVQLNTPVLLNYNSYFSVTVSSPSGFVWYKTDDNFDVNGSFGENMAARYFYAIRIYAQITTWEPEFLEMSFPISTTSIDIALESQVFSAPSNRYISHVEFYGLCNYGSFGLSYQDTQGNWVSLGGKQDYVYWQSTPRWVPIYLKFNYTRNQPYKMSVGNLFQIVNVAWGNTVSWYQSSIYYRDGKAYPDPSYTYAFRVYTTNKPNVYPYNISLVKLNTNGVQQWKQQYTMDMKVLNILPRPSLTVTTDGYPYMVYGYDATTTPLQLIPSLTYEFNSEYQLWKTITEAEPQWQSFTDTSGMYLYSYGAFLIIRSTLHNGSYQLELRLGEGLSGDVLVTSPFIAPTGPFGFPIGQFIMYQPPVLPPFQLVMGQKYTIVVRTIGMGVIAWGYDTNNPVINGRSSLDPVGHEEYDFFYKIQTQQYQGQEANIIVKKTDQSGNQIWAATSPFNTQYSEIYPSIAIDTSGNSYVTYFTNGITSGQTNTGSNDIVVIKLDASGNTLWIQQNATFNTISIDQYPMIGVDPGGNSYITYSTTSSASGQTNLGRNDIVIFKLNTSGETQWLRQQSIYNTTDYDVYPSICVDQYGNSFVAFETRGLVSGQEDSGGTDIVILKIDTNGIFQRVAQHHLFNTVNYDVYPKITVDIGGTLYITYQTSGSVTGQTNYSGSDIVVFKFVIDPARLLFMTYQATILDSPLYPGGQIKYNYKIKNNGPEGLYNIVINASSTGLSWYIPFLASGAEQEGDAIYLVNAIDINNGQIISTATAVGHVLSETCQAELTSTLIVPQIIEVNLLVYTGTVNPGPIVEGHTITYEYQIKNVGNINLNNVNMVDTNGIDISIGDLYYQQEKSFNGLYFITQEDIEQGYIQSQATVTGYFKTSSSSDNLMITTILAQTPSISLTVTTNPDTYYYTGSFINYTYEVTNTGNVILRAPISVHNTLVALDFSSPNDLAPGQTIIGTGSYNPVTQNDLDNGSINAVITAQGYFQSNPITTIQTIQVLAIQNPQLSIDKETHLTYFDTVGTVIDYSYEVTNNGNVTLSSPFTISDDRITVTYTAPSELGPGQQFTGTGSYTVTQNDLDFGSVINIAKAQNIYKSNLIESFASSTKVDAHQYYSIHLTKIANPLTCEAIGDIISYTYTVLNTGNVTLVGPFEITDDELTVDGSIPLFLAPNHTFPVVVNYSVVQTDIDRGIIVNHAYVRGYFNQDPVVSDSMECIVTVNQNPALTVTKEVSQLTYDTIDTVINYTYTVTNTGNVKLSGPFIITDDKLVISQSQMVSLDPLQSFISNVSYTIIQDDLDRGSITNTASVSGYLADTLVQSAPVSVTVNAIQFAGMILDKTANMSTYQSVGEEVIYTYMIQNNNTPFASNVTLVPPFSVVDGSELVTLDTISSLAPQATLRGYATHKITQTDLDLGWIGNSATAYGYFGSSQIQSNTVLLSVNATQNPSILLAVYQGAIPGTDIIVVGTIIIYTYTVLNNGNVTLTDVKITDTNGLSFDIGTMAPGLSQTVSGQYNITQPNINNGQITTQATVTSVFQRQSVNNVVIKTRREKQKIIRVIDQPSDQKETTVQIKQSAQIQMVKRTNSVGDHVGDIIQYQITITNTGNVTLHNIKLIDPLLDMVKTVKDLTPLDSYKQLYKYVITQQDFDNNMVVNKAQVSAYDPTNQLVYVQAHISVVPCLIGTTLISMADGTKKPISQIQRGDIVKPNHRVARLCETYIESDSVIDMIIFNTNSLGPNYPDQLLIVTSDHPIFYQGARRPAKCFTRIHGVRKEAMKELGSLYDLQFEYDGSYYANGVEVQSCSPHSALNPLPRDLYYDSSLYVDDVVWDSFDQQLQLITDKL